MPGGDGTGPAGMGPMTGRGAGFCAGYDIPGYANSVPRRYVGASLRADGTDYPVNVGMRRPAYGPVGRGMGMGRGRGRRGWRR